MNLCYEIHPGEDLHDGETYEMFLEEVNNHLRACLLYDPSHFVLQGLKYLDYIDFYHERIKMFHVKDAEFNPTGKQECVWWIPEVGLNARTDLDLWVTDRLILNLYSAN